MVLFKRKPVNFLPRPHIEDGDTEVWLIPETQELFVSYESYLQRMDWYKARKFICEISGHSGLSFFDALKSETAGAREVEGTFPEKLKQPILRKIHLSTVSRIDNLVDQVYDFFRTDFYPGEEVIVTIEGERHNAKIRDKARFPEIKDADDGTIMREAFTRYFVVLIDKHNEEKLVDDSNVTRDRKAFTKQMLRSFIKNTASREAWNGAPWLVKDDIGRRYDIDLRVPPHLQYSYKVIEKKEKRKAEIIQEASAHWSANKLPDLRPASKSKKGPMSPAELAMTSREQWDEYQRQQQMLAHSPTVHHHAMPADETSFLMDNSQLMPNNNAYASNGQIPAKQMYRPPMPPAHVIKYPIEDMDCPPLRDESQRPPIKFVCPSQLKDGMDDIDLIPGLNESNVGQLLEIWNTLNVYCQVLKLDSFTFDDFVDAMQWTDRETECELLIEAHCAILKTIVNSERDQNGSIQISLPLLPLAEELADEEPTPEESREPTPEPEPDVPARRTRSSLNKMTLPEDSEPPEEVVPHRAAELSQLEYGWIERLRKRDFANGGWIFILIGLINQVSGRPRPGFKANCDRILSAFVPLDTPPSQESIQNHYYAADINARIDALQLVCQLFVETKTCKTFLEEMAATMTEYRKKKIEHQRARKDNIAAIKKLQLESLDLAPPDESPPPPIETEENGDIEMTIENDMDTLEPDQSDQEINSDSENEPTINRRSLRRGEDRNLEAKRKREELETAKALKKAEKATKGSKEYQKCLKELERHRAELAEHDSQIEIVDDDLREADAYRTRCLGKDRFCNRYWWFERNAMPRGGLPDSSTADADYANGRLWVQGPDDMEREGYIDVAEEARGNYFRCFQMTPADRKAQEEGPTNVHTASQWGFYDDGDDIDKLIDWLDSRGVRELKLKKELSTQRKILKQYMANRIKYVHPERVKRPEPEDEKEDTDKENIQVDGDLVNGKNKSKSATLSSEDEDERIVSSVRTSSRIKAQSRSVEPEAETPIIFDGPRVLRWRNTTAVTEIGHRHVDPPPTVQKKGRGSQKRGFAAVNDAPTGSGFVGVNAGRETRKAAKIEEVNVPLNRQGKPSTRQGGRYTF